MTVPELQKIVWQHYRKHGRHTLPWRQTTDAYHILVSEVMLQQTQVDRVIPKYRAFIKKFPTVRKLAVASQADVLKLWSGLGYNRRALYLWSAAKAVVADFDGKVPVRAEELEQLSGVGPYTARAVAVYAYNQPEVFIETNVRTVFIHYFFPNRKKVADKDLLPFIQKALPPRRSREWYSALMDYGSWLKKEKGNFSRKSTQYAKQSKFAGSHRQLRGAIVRLLVEEKIVSREVMAERFSKDSRFAAVLLGLVTEGFVAENKRGYTLS